MPDSFTPQLSLCQPEVGSSRDTWGAKWNNNATILDQFISIAAPIGMLADFAGPNAPSGWLIADGRTVSRVTYAALFTAIGTVWGSGDGSTTFNLPSLNGRSTVGPGTVIDEAGFSMTFTLTQQAGFIWKPILQAHLPNYTLTTDQAPPHTHGGTTQNAGAHGHTMDAQGQHGHGGGTANNNLDHYHTAVTDAQGLHQHSVMVPVGGTTSSGGGGSPGANATNWPTDFQGSHQHNVTTGGASTAHSHVIYADGNHAHNVYAVGDHYHAIWQDGWHTHQVPLGGGGQALEVLNPILVVTKIIYAGKQAATSLAALDAASVAATGTEHELDAIREELAALRALFETPRQRLLSAPSRGPH